MIYVWVAVHLVVFTIVYSIGEWYIHRHWMHKPGKVEYYHPHHVEHHGMDRQETEHVDLHWTLALSTWFYTSPVWAIITISTGQFYTALAWLAWLLACMWLWSHCHRHMHDEKRSRWVEWLPFYWPMLRHHLKHHDRPNRNLGALFIFSDYFFKTKV